MKLVIFGLTMSSSWGNGHATIWRSLCKSLVRRGHEVTYFEKDVPYYASHRDRHEFPGMKLVLYEDWAAAKCIICDELSGADAGMVTSFCPDGILATDFVLSSALPLKVFYDLDTPVTLQSVRFGQNTSYLGQNGLRDFDLVLSYTGGGALTGLMNLLGARRVAPLYGCVDPDSHRPVPGREPYRCDLSYLGTYAEDRQKTLEALFIEPARQLAQRRFIIGGAQYPVEFPWTENIYFLRHVPPPEHPVFYCSSGLTLNVTRGVMAEMGYCPSGRLFEAAACGVPILSDTWEGMEQFFRPGSEILIARSSEEAIAALKTPREELKKISAAARQRVLEEHTAEHRVIELENCFSEAISNTATASQRL